jgi:putative heme-binding domain-containing protein
MVKMTRPTDADIDAFGKLYCASWRGATFSWEGPRVGYIVQVRPKDASNQPLLDYRSASVEQLMEELDGPSYRRRLAAIRELQSRGESKAEGWLAKQLTQRTPERQEASKIFQMSGEDLAAAMQSKDPVLSHLARQRAIRLKADQLCIDAAKRHPEQAPVYWRALGEIHTMPAVDALLDQLNQHSSPEVVAALCRLYFREAVWTGDSWGTRPDTRGPYYELEAWEGTLRISEALEAFAEESDFEQAVHLQQVARKHRIPLEAPRIRLLQLATEDQQYADRTLAILATSEGVPENAMEFLEPLTHRTQLGIDSRQHLVASLGKIPEAEAILGAIRVVGETWRDKSFEAADKERLTEIFLKSPNLPFQEEWLEELAEERSDPAWLSAATLLQIAGNSDAPQVFRQGAQRWIDQQWADAEEGKLVLLEAIAETRNRVMAPRVLEALSDPNGDIQALAQVAADRLGVRRIPDETPKAKEIGLEEFASRAMGMQGDATLGELVFMKSNCAACHTVDTRQQPKGPYLGNIAKTYPRDELARNIAFPNRTIAQGFKTETFLTDESQVLTGFVVREAADQVAIRDSQGKEHQLEVASIVERKALPVSSMPDGLLDSMSVLEFASLLDYLQALAQKQ